MIFKLFLLSTLVGLASSACFDNGDKEIGGSCYKFVAQKLSFEDARNWCHYKNPVTASYLAYVPNQFTSNFLASYARSAFGTNDGSFWIGLSRKSGGSWSWDAGFQLGYTNFGDQVGQNYVAESIVNAKWNTFGASDTNFFVCGYDPAAPPTFAPQTAGPSGPTPTMRATTQPVPTTTDNGFCTPLKDTTFVFAYSNDLYPSIVENLLGIITSDSLDISPHYTSFASIRFDTKGPSDFEYHNSWNGIDSYVKSHLPDPSLSFESTSAGSDVLKVIDRFLNNNLVPVCGSKLLLLVKRYPNETDISQTTAKLQQHHVYLSIAVDTRPSGGLHPESLYSLATRTNGICGFGDDQDMVMTADTTETCYVPYLMYAANPKVSGNGSVQLTPWSIPSGTKDWRSYFITMTIVDKNEYTDVARTVLLEWTNDDVTLNFKEIGMNSTIVQASQLHGSLLGGWIKFHPASYNMTLHFGYSDNQLRTLQIRIYGQDESPIDYWLPYDN